MPIETMHYPGVYILRRPDNAGPVIVDSPHSGRAYPDDFNFSCPFDDLRRAEDLFVDELLKDLPGAGISVLLARFPRAYVDVNRAISDIDEALIDGPWPGLIDRLN